MIAQVTSAQNISARWRRAALMAGSMAAFCVVAAGCGDGNDDSAQDTTTTATVTSEATADESEPAAGEDADDGEATPVAEDDDEPATDDDEASTDDDELTDNEAAQPDDVDPAWEILEESWFVWNVASDDVLNVRVAPDAASDILAVLAPDASGITRYSEVSWNGDTAWGVVLLDGDVGWVALDYLRPLPGQADVVGDPDSPAMASALITAQEGLADPAKLASLVGDSGLLLSADGYVSEDDQVLSASEVAAAAQGASRIWGYEAGEGSAIEMSVADYFDWLKGSTALTSTEVTSYGTVVGSGTTINNIEEAFPGSNTVEYHHRGTSYYGGLDWQSIRFVFDTTGSEPVLLAIIRDEWTP